jgi:hypothetical protein
MHRVTRCWCFHHDSRELYGGGRYRATRSRKESYTDDFRSERRSHLEDFLAKATEDDLRFATNFDVRFSGKVRFDIPL